MPYKFLEHTSDLIVQGENTTFETALENVAAGMFTQMGSEHAKLKETLQLEVFQENQEDLVVAALTAIIAECETERFIPKKAEIQKIAGGLRIMLSGEHKQPENIIKAVTYHELKIEKKGSKCRITVLFDI